MNELQNSFFCFEYLPIIDKLLVFLCTIECIATNLVSRRCSILKLLTLKR